MYTHIVDLVMASFLDPAHLCVVCLTSEGKLGGSLGMKLFSNRSFFYCSLSFVAWLLNEK